MTGIPHRKPESIAEDAALPGEPEQAERFQTVRRAHQSEAAEDYVELIADLIESTGEARPVQIARRLGVSHATVVKAVGRLCRDGLTEAQPYRGVSLSPLGWSLASAVRERHRLVVDFLVALGVSPKAAEIDAEGLEHHVGEETLAAFRRHLGR